MEKAGSPIFLCFCVNFRDVHYAYYPSGTIIARAKQVTLSYVHSKALSRVLAAKPGFKTLTPKRKLEGGRGGGGLGVSSQGVYARIETAVP